MVHAQNRPGRAAWGGRVGVARTPLTCGGRSPPNSRACRRDALLPFTAFLNRFLTRFLTRRGRRRAVTVIDVPVNLPQAARQPLQDHQVLERFLNRIAGFRGDRGRGVATIIGPIARQLGFQRSDGDFDGVRLEHRLVQGLDGRPAINGRLIDGHHDRVIGEKGGKGCCIVGIEGDAEFSAERIDRCYVGGDIPLVFRLGPGLAPGERQHRCECERAKSHVT
ncbi:hypothetical protein SBA6_150024 [Candidatus Sulfopaludibacter sp. SbA6]|nr:hypothetical protein SBA6_150024 [Candidatus Sulfopaludibacter sp. SbA6]